MTPNFYKSKKDIPSSSLIFSTSLRRRIQEMANKKDTVATLLVKAMTCPRYQNSKVGMNYFSFREKESLISYMPSNRLQQFSDDGSWKKEGRQDTKIARFARALLHPRIVARLKDNNFAAFADSLIALVKAQDYEFEYVSVEDGYTKLSGVHSCMAGKPVHKFYKMFECGVLVLKDTRPSANKNACFARAILWENVILDGSKSIRLLDRVYATRQIDYSLYKQWAMDNNVYYRNNADSIISPTGEVLNNVALLIHKKFPRPHGGRNYFPYLDTFRYCDRALTFITNKFGHYKQTTRLLQSTNNCTEDISHQVMTVCGRVLDKTSCIKFGDEYHYKYGNTVCTINGKYYLRTSPKVCIVNKRYCLLKDTVKIGRWRYLKTDRKITKVGKKWMLAKNVKPKPLPKKVSTITKVKSDPIDIAAPIIAAMAEHNPELTPTRSYSILEWLMPSLRQVHANNNR